MHQPKISVVTPSYNQGRFIRRTLESVLERQDYDNVEHLVIDGLSSDGTTDILMEYKNRYPDKLFFVSERDTGGTSAINKGFRKSTGDIVGWIASDDYYEDDIFGYVVGYFEKNAGVDMIYGGCNEVNESGGYIRRFEDNYGFKRCRIRDYEVFNYNTLLNVYSGLIPQQAVFLRREIFEKVGYLDESYEYAMDYEYWLRIGQKCHIERVNKTLADFRRHRAAKTNVNNIIGLVGEPLRARKKYGGKYVAPMHFYIGWVLFKVILKMSLIKIHVLDGDKWMRKY